MPGLPSAGSSATGPRRPAGARPAGSGSSATGPRRPAGAPPAGAPPSGARPPVPQRRPRKLLAHGDVRTDDWYWLRDRDDPLVLDHLRAENAYADAVLAELAPLRETLFEEMVARIAETDLSVPVRHGPWWYSTRTEQGRSYPIHCRRPAAPSSDPPLDTRPAEDEQVLLDENALAEGLEFLEVANLTVSPDHRRLAYGTDTTGGEVFTLSFHALADGAEETPEVVAGTSYGLAWSADSTAVFYTRADAAMRPFQVWRHRLGTDPSTDVLVLEEPDEQFTLSVGHTKDRVFVVIALQSTTTSEVWVVPASAPHAAPRLIEGRRHGVEYAVEHRAAPPGPDAGPGLFVILTNDGATDFRLVVAADSAPGREGWREVLPHRPGTRLEDVDVFDRWLVVTERHEGESRIRVVDFEGDDVEAVSSGRLLGDELLRRSRLVPAGEHPSTTRVGPNPEAAATLLRYEQTSLVSPAAVLDLDMASGEVHLRKRQPVLGGYDPSEYRTQRLWATAPDGTRVPISVVHRADLLPRPGDTPGTPLRRPAPCVLYGYGAYEHSVDPVFSSLRLSLLDRGFVYAIAHVRGGGELGRAWYEHGKLGAKPHTFSDFIACARHLVDTGFTTPELLAARGASAGGLLVGAVLNQAPGLFRAAVAEVPFVDCLTTMLDDSLPLTVGEWEEWGNPVADPEAYAVIKGYSPYDNIRPPARDGDGTRSPRILVTAGLHDSRVGFWEPAKWVARMREADPGAVVVLRTELAAGHGGPSGRYQAWRDEALVQAFLLDALVGD